MAEQTLIAFFALSSAHSMNSGFPKPLDRREKEEEGSPQV